MNVRVRIDGVMWLRAAAKMTLGVMSLSQPDDWLDTPSARQLIGWLWDETPVDQDGQPASLFPRSPDESEAELFPPPAHIILQTTMRDGRVAVSFGLFGKHIVGLPVEVLERVPDTCWIMAAGEPFREVSLGDLAQEWAEKRIRDEHAAAQYAPSGRLAATPVSAESRLYRGSWSPPTPCRFIKRHPPARQSRRVVRPKFGWLLLAAAPGASPSQSAAWTSCESLHRHGGCPFSAVRRSRLWP